MAFPFNFEENFESGTLGGFNSESDSAGILDFPHYSVLAANSNVKTGPHRGAYCMRITPNGGTTTAALTETEGFDAELQATVHFRWGMYFNAAFTMANNDEFIVLSLVGADQNIQVIVNFTTANGLRMGMTNAGVSTSLVEIAREEWLNIEFTTTIEANGATDGTMDMWIDNQSLNQIGTVGSAAITTGTFGMTSPDAGTSGTILFDGLIVDDARIGPLTRRYSSDFLMTQSGHAFIGPGSISNISLISGAATDNILRAYDTDIGSTTAEIAERIYLRNSAQLEAVDMAQPETHFDRGCYIRLTGTNPQAMVSLGHVSANSDGGVRNTGAKRRPERLGL